LLPFLFVLLALGEHVGKIVFSHFMNLSGLHFFFLVVLEACVNRLLLITTTKSWSATLWLICLCKVSTSVAALWLSLLLFRLRVLIKLSEGIIIKQWFCPVLLWLSERVLLWSIGLRTTTWRSLRNSATPIH
jgi:hypothetical protein